MRAEMKTSIDSLRSEMKLRDDMQAQAMRNIAESSTSRSTFAIAWPPLKPACPVSNPQTLIKADPEPTHLRK